MKTTLRTEPYKMLKRTTQPPRRRVLIEEGLAKSSKKQHSENTDKWYLRNAGSFSYSESLWTPPLEGTSLHWWNNDVGRPWGIFSLFTTCLRLWVKLNCDLLPHLLNMPLKAVCRTCPQKSSWKKERRVLQNAEKKTLVLGFLHSINHRGSPQDRKSSKHKFFKERKIKQPTILDTTQSTANTTSISIYISLIYN